MTRRARATPHTRSSGSASSERSGRARSASISVAYRRTSSERTIRCTAPINSSAASAASSAAGSARTTRHRERSRIARTCWPSRCTRPRCASLGACAGSAVKLGPLLASANVPVPAGAEELDVRAIAYDSRKAAPGSLFVAIEGFHRDGHDFVADAVKSGAVAVVAQRKVRTRVPVAVVADSRAALADLAAELFEHPTRKLKLVSVTGTDGKTTTVHLISDVLEAGGESTGFATTVDFKIADHLSANDTRQSTQEAVEIQEFFAELLVAGGTWGVLEATSHALALRKLRGTEVDIAVFTNLSPEHLDFHGTLQSYLEAKGILFDMLGQGTDKGVPKTAVLNADDTHWQYLVDRAAGAKVITYGIDAHADVQGTVLAADANGSRVRVETHGESVEIALPLVGRFNVQNALAAIAAGVAAGVPLAKAREALQRAKPVRGRMERVDRGQPFSVIVDYAHTPESQIGRAHV